MDEDLKQSFQQIVNDFGPDIINDKNLANIVADYFSFDRNPAIRNILKAIVIDGYATKITQLKTSKGDPSIDLERYASEIEQSWGYRKEQVRDVLLCIASSIGIVCKIDNSTNQNQQSILLSTNTPQINKPKKPDNNSNQNIHNNYQPQKSSLIIKTLTLIRITKLWEWCLVLLVFVVSFLIGWSINMKPLGYILIGLSGSFYSVGKIRSSYLLLYFLLLGSCTVGLIVGSISEYIHANKQKKEIQLEINRMINESDTLALYNYINENSHYDALDYYERKKISDIYDSLKYIKMGCDRIVEDMSAHTKVLNSYGFSDTSLRDMYSESFYNIISTLMDYQPYNGQPSRDYMINKLITYLNYGHGIISGAYNYYPWNNKSYSNWKRFTFADPNNVMIQCIGYGGGLNYSGIESFQVRLVKENDIWLIDDYVKHDGTSLKAIYNQYIKGK